MLRFSILLAVLPLMAVAQEKSALFPDAYLPGDGVQPPAQELFTQPNYTEAARELGIEGNVLLRIVVNEQGGVEEIRVISPLDPGLDHEATEAVRTWRFKPATLEKHPVRCVATVQVKFNLDEDRERWPEIRLIPDEGRDTTPPELTYFADATFTPEMFDAQVHGTVGLELVVNAEGVPTEVQVIAPLHPSVDQASAEAAKRWRFRPSMLTGAPVPARVRAELSVDYRPRSSNPPPRIGEDITPPSVLYKIEPQYSEEARRVRVQGFVGISLVVDESGLPTDLVLRSPLGYGLDEKAMEAVKKWRFRPGQKDGKAVPVRALVQVTFKFLDRPFDAKAEQRRFQYNLDLHSLESSRLVDPVVLRIRSQALENYPPAMLGYSTLLKEGYGVERHAGEATEWLLKAADRDVYEAMMEAAQMYLSGKGVEQDFKRGKKLLEKAAKDRNSPDAQFFLGRSYESGTSGFEIDLDDAVDYYRMCGSATMLCQLGAGRSLLHKQKRRDKDLAEAVAWLELAAAQDSQEARDLLDREVPELTDDLRNQVAERKAELTRQ